MHNILVHLDLRSAWNSLEALDSVGKLGRQVTEPKNDARGRPVAW